MEGAASMAVKGNYMVFGGLDGWITLLEVLSMRPSATSVSGLKLLVYQALSY